MQLILAYVRDILLGHSLLPFAKLRIARWGTFLNFGAFVCMIHLRKVDT